MSRGVWPKRSSQGLREFRDLVVLLGIEQMETVEVVVILGAGDELAEADGPILGQGEVLNEPHFAGQGWGGQKESTGQGQHGLVHGLFLQGQGLAIAALLSQRVSSPITDDNTPEKRWA